MTLEALDSTMSLNVTLSDSQWLKILAFLRTCPRVYVGKEESCRLFLEAVFWITQTGVQWRLLPEEYGYWNSVYKRFARWHDHGVWEAMRIHFADDPDIENLIPCSLMKQHGHRFAETARHL